MARHRGKSSRLKLSVVEDCAGLGTGSLSLHELLNKKSDLKRSIKVRTLFASENNPHLNRYLHNVNAQIGKRLFRHIEADCTIGLREHWKEHFIEHPVDVYLNGASCCPFSSQGSNRSFGDKRAQTSKHALRFIDLVRPRMFILEQVMGFISKRHKNGFNKFMARLKNIKNSEGKPIYNLKEKVINSLHHGVAQSRQRYFLVGLHRSSKCLRSFTFPKARAAVVLPKTMRDLALPSQKPRTETEKRNFDALLPKILSLDKDSLRKPIVLDLQSSESFGTHMKVGACPAITKAGPKDKLTGYAIHAILSPSRLEICT